MVTAEEYLTACRTNNITAIRQYIADGGDVNVQDMYGQTALMATAYHSRTKGLKELIAAGADLNLQDRYGEVALMRALNAKQYGAAQLLVAAGADIYAMDNDGRTAIDCCKSKRVKAKLVKLSQRNIRAAIKSSEKPAIIKGFDSEL